jgi:3-hydroxyisobutyrate dehydrogenase-like beta-hydroxyacid dehydrogenase
VKLGMVGLGRMGGNMTERLRGDGHEVETYARTAPEHTTGSPQRSTSRASSG